MADAGNPIDPNDLGELTAETERFGDVTQSLNLQLERTSNLLNSIPSGIFDSVGKSASVSAQNVNRLFQDVEKLKKGAKDIRFDMDPLGDLIRTSKPSDVRDAIGGAMVGAAQMVSQAFKSMQELSKNTTQSIAAIGTLGFAKAKVEAIKLINQKTGYIDLEKQLMGVQKAALQMGMAFGDSFGEASKGSGFFESSMVDTIRTLKATDEELRSVRGSLKEAFAAREMFKNIEGLDLSLQGVQSNINLTNVALSVAKATGMDVSSVAKQMSDMHLLLGSSLEDTALSFGRIKDAANDSKLSYDMVSKTIVDSAKTLKFYGATVESVSPLFKSFNASLRGIGKEGLTPELLQDFVGGLQKMQMGTRALLGLRMPGAGAGRAGILGGGLRVERAMETGEGMGDVVKSLTATMKQFGGQNLLTREQAIESPAAERNFIIQRQILGQLTGINDAGKQNQMMKILQDIDKHGLEGSAGAEEKLGELMASGEKVADETTDTLTKVDMEYKRTRMTQGHQIIELLKLLATETGVRDLLKTSSDIIDSITGSIGEVNFDAFEKAAEGLDYRQVEATKTKLGERQTEMASMVGDKSLGEKYRRSVADEMKKVVITKTMFEIKAEYDRVIMSAMRAKPQGSAERGGFITSGIVSQSTHKEALKTAEKSAKDRIKELRGLMRKPEITTEQKRVFKVEMSGLKKALESIGSGKAWTKKDRPEGTDIRSIKEFKKRQQERIKMIGGAQNDAMRLAEDARKMRETDTRMVPINIEEDRKQRTRTGLKPTMLPKPVEPHEPRTTPSAPQEINGEIMVKVRVDQDGRLVTEDHVVRIVKGEIRDEGTGAKKY